MLELAFLCFCTYFFSVLAFALLNVCMAGILYLFLRFSVFDHSSRSRKKGNFAQISDPIFFFFCYRYFTECNKTLSKYFSVVQTNSSNSNSVNGQSHINCCHVMSRMYHIFSEWMMTD